MFEGWFFAPYGTADINAEDTIDSAFFSIGFYDIWDLKQEYGSLSVGGFTEFSNEEISPSNSIFLADVSSLLNGHLLTVTVDRLRGDFGVSFTSLTGSYTDNAVSSVPELGSLALLGLGLAGLGFARRKTAA